jgi:hypothetical protein
MELLNNLKKFKNLPHFEKKLFFLGIFYIPIILFITKLLPFKFYKKHLSKSAKSISGTRKNPGNEVKLVMKTLRRIERFLGFKLYCLPKSILLKILFNDLGIKNKLGFGVNKNKSQIIAHSYIILEDMTLDLNGFTNVLII